MYRIFDINHRTSIWRQKDGDGGCHVFESETMQCVRESHRKKYIHKIDYGSWKLITITTDYVVHQRIPRQGEHEDHSAAQASSHWTIQRCQDHSPCFALVAGYAVPGLLLPLLHVSGANWPLAHEQF